MLHCSCTQAECARWAVIDTWPQTRVVVKTYRKDPAGSRNGAVYSATHPGTLRCPLQVQTHRDKYTLVQMRKTACGTGFVLSDVAVILLQQDQ